MTSVDVLVAVRNEEEAIPAFLREVAGLRLPPGVELRVVFVEDSSRDGTRALLGRLAAEDPRVGYYCLERGFGQGPALIFGLSRSRADAAVMMDVDGSHPVSAIPAMIRAYLEGARVVQCVRRALPGRSALRRLGAACFHRSARLLTGVDTRDQNIFFRLVSADVARWLLGQPRYWRWLRFPLPREPGAARRIHVDTRERALGKSQYGLARLSGLAVDGILSLMPGSRLGGLLVTVGLVAAILFYSGGWPLGAAVAAGACGLVARRAELGSPGLLARMRVLGSDNAPAASGPQAGNPPPRSEG